MSRVASTKQFLELLAQSQLLAPKVLASVRRKVETLSEDVRNDPRKLAATLVNSKIVTSWQARRLLSGKGGGFHVGRYKLMDLLGSGGMGRVYLAEHLKMHQLVAIKILRPVKGKSKAAEKEVVARFAREAQAIAALSHPNIVQAFDFDEVGHLRYLVMEFVEGANAATQLLKTGPLPYDQVADYICQAAAGLKHAHDAGLVHRDVKPANILIDKTGHVKLVDLGLVSCLPDATDDGLTVDEYKLGTVDFIAPEQALSSHDVDPRADIYALGGSFYRLISGKLLFPGLNTTQKLLAQQTKQPTPIDELVPGLPEPIVNAINKMLAKDRDDRYSDVTEVAEVLQPFAKRTTPPYAVSIIPQTRAEIEPFLRRGPASLSKTSIKPVDDDVPPSQPVSAPDLVPADSVVFSKPGPSAESSVTTMGLDRTDRPTEKKSQRGLVVGGSIAAVAIAAIAGFIFLRGDNETQASSPEGTSPSHVAGGKSVLPEPTKSPATDPPGTPVVATAKPVVPPSPPARKPSNLLPLVSNIGFELDVDGDGWPDKWPPSQTEGVSWVYENNNHFVRFDSPGPGEVAAMYRAMPIPDGITEVQISWRQRVSDLVMGDRDWFDVRMTIGFMDADNNDDFPKVNPPNTKVNTDGWEQRSVTVLVPEGAAKIKVRPCLNQVQAGRLEIDDLAVMAKVEKSATEPPSTDVRDAGLHIFAVIPKATEDFSGDGRIDSGDEYVLITNTTKAPIDLTGFELSNSRGLLHVMPNKTRLWPDGELKILTAELNANPQSQQNGAWDDKADRIVLTDTLGQKVAEQFYLKATDGDEILFSSDQGQ